MVIEDERDIRESLHECLTSAGYEVLTAENGRQALAQLQTVIRPVHAILLDIQMPVMSGEAFRWEQLADPALAHIPVLVLSASPKCQTVAVKLRSAGCIRKPFDIEELLATLAGICLPQASQDA
ncbi:MAG: response regulator receiver protein [Myxococcaceae bacterium]|nr:response regulator receiver protein [Myxococcaceae bacterium]